LALHESPKKGASSHRWAKRHAAPLRRERRRAPLPVLSCYCPCYRRGTLIMQRTARSEELLCRQRLARNDRAIAGEAWFPPVHTGTGGGDRRRRSHRLGHLAQLELLDLAGR